MTRGRSRRTAAEITEGGERVTHLYPNDCYFAHLSIYRFAVPLSLGRRVLDAGCGAGYGSHYLAAHGAASVLGCDVSAAAIDFSRDHFRRPNLAYRTGDLRRLADLPSGSFDLVFSSNALEHVADVPAFLHEACRVLDRNGALLIAVPPVVCDRDRQVNLENPYHLNIWTPRQWYGVLSRYFDAITPYWHGFHRPGATLDFGHTPEQCGVDENDFVFEPVAIEAFYRRPALTVILVGTMPRAAETLPDPTSPVVMVEGSFSRAPAYTGAPGSRRAATLRRLCGRAVTVLHERGAMALAAAVVARLRRRSAARAHRNGSSIGGRGEQ